MVVARLSRTVSVRYWKKKTVGSCSALRLIPEMICLTLGRTVPPLSTRDDFPCSVASLRQARLLNHQDSSAYAQQPLRSAHLVRIRPRRVVQHVESRTLRHPPISRLGHREPLRPPDVPSASSLTLNDRKLLKNRHFLHR